MQTYLSRLFLVLAFLSVATLTWLADERADELRVNGFPNDADFFPIGVWLQRPVALPITRQSESTHCRICITAPPRRSSRALAQQICLLSRAG